MAETCSQLWQGSLEIEPWSWLLLPSTASGKPLHLSLTWSVPAMWTALAALTLRGQSAFEVSVVGVQLSPAWMCSPWPYILQWNSSRAEGQAENRRPLSQKNRDHTPASHSLTTVLSTESPGSSKGHQRYWNYCSKITLKVKYLINKYHRSITKKHCVNEV